MENFEIHVALNFSIIYFADSKFGITILLIICIIPSQPTTPTPSPVPVSETYAYPILTPPPPPQTVMTSYFS